jgi:predicted nuclease with TOPRIM domain
MLLNQNKELFLMDSYYRDLMAKERAAFERILQSRLNFQQRETERKMLKQISNARGRLAKAEHLEGKVKESHAHAKRLMNNIEGLKKSKKQQEKQVQRLNGENEQLRRKLDDLWAHQEDQNQHVMLMTKYTTN